MIYVINFLYYSKHRYIRNTQLWKLKADTNLLQMDYNEDSVALAEQM